MAGPSAGVGSQDQLRFTPLQMSFYTAQMTPTAVASPSSNSYSVTITNDPSTTSSQNMGSATVVVPAGFTITSTLTAVATGGKTWDAALVAGVIQLVANPGTQKLGGGESVTVTFTATAPILANCTNQTYQFTSVGFNGTDFSTPYTLTRSPALGHRYRGLPAPHRLYVGSGSLEEWLSGQLASQRPERWAHAGNCELHGRPAREHLPARRQREARAC